ncbi:MAG: D-alanine--D-alanine ligase [Planctomycetota bacterium]
MAATKTRFDISKLIRTPMQQKLAVTVLSGGPSGERDVSLDSGKSVARALESLGHKVYIEDINADNLAALARQVDCVFIALHGAFGEDGQVQEILERRNLAYTGSSPEACRLAMNKAEAKKTFAKLNIPTPRWDVATAKTYREAVAAWTMPVVVKPVSEGSSIHCYIVRDVAQFRPAVEKVIDAYGEALIEEYIPGREITVGILGDKALPPIEIRTKRDYYDYAAKYVDDDTQYDFDISLPEELLDRIVEMSLAAHNGLGCRDFSRLDWRVNDSCLQPFLLEANVIPGLTSHSLVPKAAQRAGLPMPEMCQLIIDMAIKRKFAR